MSAATCTTTVGVFSNPLDATAAIAALRDAGFTTNEIGALSRHKAEPVTSSGTGEKTAETEGEDAGEGALVGAITGAGIGGLVGLGVLSGIIPIVGPALFAGTLGVLASNAAAGAAVAGVTGALVGWGVPREDATYYESEVAAGRTIVTVSSSERCDEARQIIRTHGGTSRGK